MASDRNHTPLYPIGVTERLTGLTARQIRYWEANSLLQPARTRGRQRLYSDADVSRLKEVKRLIAEGLTLERIKHVLLSRDRRLDRAEMGSAQIERGARTPSLYPLTNRDELLRLIDRED